VSVAEAGPALVIGPGTGLGAAVCIPQPRGTVVLPTEAGMTAFAPGTEREVEILRWMQRHGTRHVSTEQCPVQAVNYQALCELDCTRPCCASRRRSPARGSATRSLEAVLTFCGLLGSVIGDLAVISGARVVRRRWHRPQLVDFCQPFHARTVDKGHDARVLERVPVRDRKRGSARSARRLVPGTEPHRQPNHPKHGRAWTGQRVLTHQPRVHRNRTQRHHCPGRGIMQVRKNILTMSIVAALGVSGTVAAQDAPKTDPKDLETVVVTGIRGSVEKSLDVKREAKGHVSGDRQDIGKMPDRTWPTHAAPAA
jgi:hypothetical protein